MKKGPIQGSIYQSKLVLQLLVHGPCLKWPLVIFLFVSHFFLFFSNHLFWNKTIFLSHYHTHLVAQNICKVRDNNFLLVDNQNICKLAKKTENFNLKNIINKIHKKLKFNVNCHIKTCKNHNLLKV
jgi:hypothetical protein